MSKHHQRIKKINFTGAFKLTPGHSKIDYEIAIRHNLPVMLIINESGILNENCGEWMVSFHLFSIAKIMNSFLLVTSNFRMFLDSLLEI